MDSPAYQLQGSRALGRLFCRIHSPIRGPSEVISDLALGQVFEQPPLAKQDVQVKDRNICYEIFIPIRQQHLWPQKPSVKYFVTDLNVNLSQYNIESEPLKNTSDTRTTWLLCNGSSPSKNRYAFYETNLYLIKGFLGLLSYVLKSTSIIFYIYIPMG